VKDNQRVNKEANKYTCENKLE